MFDQLALSPVLAIALAAGGTALLIGGLATAARAAARSYRARAAAARQERIARWQADPRGTARAILTLAQRRRGQLVAQRDAIQPTQNGANNG
ncbi:MAG: hypothetical protein LBD97_01520 [Bifidobacteriaceae bacterium]|jgi:hypothetical protein|nr:hypothetical protein [Bifidobacteriaceae bacterium]